MTFTEIMLRDRFFRPRRKLQAPQCPSSRVARTWNNDMTISCLPIGDGFRPYQSNDAADRLCAVS